MNKIKIRCPFCSKVLIVADDPANSGKKLTCPVCKQTNLFDDFARVEESPKDDSTQIGGRFKSGKASFRLRYKDYTYPLDLGLNTIGRKASTSSAKIQIDNSEDTGFSRLHLNLEIVKGCDDALHCYLSNAANKNPTYLNGELVCSGEKIGLESGDKIKSSNTELVFVKELEFDDDETRL